MPTLVLHAGDGSGEHPTQEMLDLFTMLKEKGGRVDGLTITFVGDLKYGLYGRTVHSLVLALALFDGVRINLVAPAQLQVPQVVQRV